MECEGGGGMRGGVVSEGGWSVKEEGDEGRSGE